MKDEAIITQEAPASNQPSFQQLLAAAFIVQEHNDKLQSGNDPNAAYTRTLAEIVETERLIQDPRVDFHTALELIAERTHTITRADGVALGLLENGRLIYRADTGDANTQLNAPALITATLAAECFRTGKALQSPESRGDHRIDPGLRQQMGVESLLAVPIRQEGKIAGVLELRYKCSNGFDGQALRTGQLMSGLIGEVLTKKAKQGWKQALASSEEEAVRSVLDHIQPELDRFEERDDDFDRAVSSLTANSESASHSVDLTEFDPPPAPTVIAQAPESSAKSRYSETLCVRCGHAFAGDEAFCGLCGAMRSDDSPVVLNPKAPTWTSLWDLQETEPLAAEVGAEAPSNGNHGASAADPDFDYAVSLLSDQPDFEEAADEQIGFSPYRRAQANRLELQASNTASAGQDGRLPGGETEEVPSAAPRGRLATIWREQRATIYLAAALGVLAVVVTSWIMQPPTPPSPAPAVAGQETPAAPELSMLDKMLVGLGLAEAPSAPPRQGDPDARVWVDVHTALYYCSGTELYGKTKGGRYAKQRDAQLDQFQPAARKACE